MAAPIITQVPTPPDMLDEPVVFVERADNLLGALPLLVTQINTSTAFVDAQAAAAEAAKGAAQTAAGTATTKASEAAGSASTASGHRTQTGLDRIATGEDRLQTGEDRDAVMDALASIADGPVTSVNGQTGVVELDIGTNAQGNKTISTGAPSGGSHGDIHYQVDA